MIQPELHITVTKTANGQNDYVQVMSADQVAVNIVLIANKIVVNDARTEDEPKDSKRPKKKPRKKA